ncbi:hypothetical protein EDB80DRAFT_591490, partial [Ilyonectria destructans]
QLWFICEILNIWSTCPLKISVGFFLLRVATNAVHIWFLRLLMTGTGLFGVAYLFFIIFQCVPVETYWEEGPITPGKCWEAKTMSIGTIGTIMAQSINTAADWCFGILPYFIVRSMNLPTSTKIVVACILGFAAIGSVATIVRAVHIPTLLESEDFLYNSTGFAFWSTVEPGVGIMAACIATLRPLYQLVSYRAGLSPDGPENVRWRNRHHGRPRDETRRLRDLELGNSARGAKRPWFLFKSFTAGGESTNPRLDPSVATDSRPVLVPQPRGEGVPNANSVRDGQD